MTRTDSPVTARQDNLSGLPAVSPRSPLHQTGPTLRRSIRQLHPLPGSHAAYSPPSKMPPSRPGRNKFRAAQQKLFKPSMPRRICGLIGIVRRISGSQRLYVRTRALVRSPLGEHVVESTVPASRRALQERPKSGLARRLAKPLNDRCREERPRATVPCSLKPFLKLDAH